MTPSSPITLGLVERSRHVGPFIISEAVHAAATSLAPHDHEHPSLTLVLDGGFVERAEGRTWDCAAGHIVAKPAGAKHANKYGAAGNRELLIEARGVDGSERSAFSLAHFRRSPLPGIGERIAAELRASDAASELLLHGWVLHLLAAMLRGNHADERQQPCWITRVRERLHSTVDDVSLHALASEANVHPVHLVRTFKRSFGLTPGAYLRRIRIARACELLKTSDASISRIAADTGFSHHAHFTRTFLALIGETPSEYRRAHRNQKR